MDPKDDRMDDHLVGTETDYLVGTETDYLVGTETDYLVGTETDYLVGTEDKAMKQPDTQSQPRELLQRHHELIYHFCRYTISWLQLFINVIVLWAAISRGIAIWYHDTTQFPHELVFWVFAAQNVLVPLQLELGELKYYQWLSKFSLRWVSICHVVRILVSVSVVVLCLRLTLLFPEAVREAIAGKELASSYLCRYFLLGYLRLSFVLIILLELVLLTLSGSCRKSEERWVAEDEQV